MASNIGFLLPMYNVEKYIAEMLRGLEAQTYKDFHVYLVDDGSTDNTLEIVNKTLEDTWINFTIGRHRENKGWAYAMNTAATHAVTDKCKYLFIANADDTIEPTLLEETIKSIGGFDWLCMPIPIMGGGRHNPSANATVQMMLRQNQMTNFCLVRSDMWKHLDGYDTEINGGNGFEDWDFWIRALKNGYKYTKLDKELYYYRNHSEQTSRKVPPSAAEAIKRKHS